jgi:hypothetical protein
MAKNYNRPPGVVITETTSQSINPLIATPDQLCLVGPAAAGIEITENVTTLLPSGTVTLTNTSNVVTGSGTNFDSTSLVGKFINVQQSNGTFKSYKVQSVESTSSLTLTTAAGSSDVISGALYSIGVPFKQVKSTDTNLAVSKVVDYDSALAVISNPGYTSAGGYFLNSYYVDTVNKTIASNRSTPVAKLNADISLSTSLTGVVTDTISALGKPTDFTSSGTIVIDSEQFKYTSIGTTNEEQQTVTLTTPVSGNFALSFSGQITDPIAHNATAATVKTNLESLSTIGSNNVDVTAGAAGGPYTITFKGDLVGDVPFVGARYARTTTVGASPSTNEVQELVFVNADTTDTFKLTTNDSTYTTDLSVASTASAVQAALEAYPAIGTGGVTVTKATGNVTTFTLTFVGSKAATNVDQVKIAKTAPDGTPVGAAFGGTAASIAVALVTGEAGEFLFRGVTRAANETIKAAHTKDSISGTTKSIKQGFVIPNNRTIYVTYTYTPADYYQPYFGTAGQFSDIESRFGKAFAEDGLTINSPLTLAAKIAIENGAKDIILQPLFHSADPISGIMPTRNRPSNTQATGDVSNTWAKTFRALQNQENIGVIVPIVGQDSAYNYGSGDAKELNNATQLSILSTLRDHIAFVDSEYDQLLIGILGEDSTDPLAATNSYADRDTVLTSHLSSLQTSQDYSERLVFIAQTYFERPSTKSANINVKLGGQYAAAAVGGKLVSYKPNISLTRKTLAGFKKIVDSRTKRIKTQDSGLGFFVIEQSQTDGTIFVRHGLTIDTSSVAKSELNVIRSKHYMIDSLRRTIDTQVIGQVIADEVGPLTIQSTVASTLRTLQDDGVIVQFDSVQAQIASIDPTQIGIRFNYRPAFAINYVNIEFSVDLTNGITSLTATDQANIGA